MSLLVVGQVSTSQKQGFVAGIIKDEKNNALTGVTVKIENKNKTAITSVSGDFNFSLAAGIYTLLITAVGFENKRITDVVVEQNKSIDVAITLSPKKSNTLTEVFVTTTSKKESASSLLRTQKNSISMTDGLSTEQMKATPDLNIGQSLTRVSGVNVQSGKFVTIRGVSDRYNNVLINGSSLPSTEPNRRNFSFDIVPSALVDNIVVNKTASPDLPGEFTGGLVQVNTKDVPTKNFLEIGIGSGINTESNDKDFIGLKRDKDAYLAKVNDDRLWFGTGRTIDGFKFFTQYVTGDSNALRTSTSKIPNRWQRYKYNYTPVQNYQINGGIAKRFKNGNSIGAVGAVTYLNENLYEGGIDENDKGEARANSTYDYASARYKYNITIGALANIAYKTKKHKIAFKNLYNLRYNNQVDDRSGLNVNSGAQNRFSDVTFQNKLLQNRLEGEHQFTDKNYKVDWYADNITFKREQPESRYLAEDIIPPSYGYNLGIAFFDRGGLFSSVFDEKRNNAGINLSVPFFFKKEKQVIKVGYAYSVRKADYENIALRIMVKNPLTVIPGSGKLPYYEIVNASNFENGSLIYSPASTTSSSAGDTYEGRQQLDAVYAMADFKLLKKLRITGGVRNETNKMDVSTSVYARFGSTTPTAENEVTSNTYKENNLLPSVNIIYSLTDKINFRTAYSKTIARPDFVERSIISIYDFSDQLIVNGDKGLAVTTIQNYDVRFEYYPAAGEILSLSYFNKNFKEPVERLLELGNPSNTLRYLNRDKAVVKGFEVDVRKNLGFIFSKSKVFERMLVSGNFTYLSGSVADSGLTKKRLIQGLSTYIINTGVSYQAPNWGLNVSFNRSGRKLLTSALESEQYIFQYENPRSVLDAQINYKIYKKKIELRFSAGDILNQPYITYNNKSIIKDGTEADPDPKGYALNEAFDLVTYKVKKGINFYFTILYKF